MQQIFRDSMSIGTSYFSNVYVIKVKPGTHDPDPKAPIPGLCNGIFTDRSIFRLSFPEKTKAVPVRWPYDVSLISCNWSSGSCGSLIRGKFNLKINRSVKTPLHEHSRVVGSGSWVPDSGRGKYQSDFLLASPISISLVVVSLKPGFH